MTFSGYPTIFMKIYPMNIMSCVRHWSTCCSIDRRNDPDNDIIRISTRYSLESTHVVTRTFVFHRWEEMAFKPRQNFVAITVRSIRLLLSNAQLKSLSFLPFGIVVLRYCFKKDKITVIPQCLLYYINWNKFILLNI